MCALATAMTPAASKPMLKTRKFSSSKDRQTQPSPEAVFVSKDTPMSDGSTVRTGSNIPCARLNENPATGSKFHGMKPLKPFLKKFNL